VFLINHVWFLHFTKPDLHYLISSIYIHQKASKPFFLFSLHIFTRDPFILITTTRRKTPQVIIIFAKNLKGQMNNSHTRVEVVDKEITGDIL